MPQANERITRKITTHGVLTWELNTFVRPNEFDMLMPKASPEGIPSGPLGQKYCVICLNVMSHSCL